jgi:hypothetical protein
MLKFSIHIHQIEYNNFSKDLIEFGQGTYLVPTIGYFPFACIVHFHLKWTSIEYSYMIVLVQLLHFQNPYFFKSPFHKSMILTFFLDFPMKSVSTN